MSKLHPCKRASSSFDLVSFLGSLLILGLHVGSAHAAQNPVQTEAVTHTAVENQGSVGFCWAYTLTGLMEGEARKQNVSANLSPEYLGFYHMYFQLQKHLSWFETVAQRISSDLRSNADSVVEDAYNRIYVQDRFFKPSEGNDEKIALQEIQISGTVPEEAFKFRVGTDAKETDFENRVKNFVKTNMLDGGKLAQYKSVDQDGINQALFSELSKALKISPPKPNDTFTFEGRSFTPRTFMTDYMRFDPKAWVELDATSDKQAKAESLIRQVLSKNIQVPVAFLVFDDTNSERQNAQILVEKNGEFSTRFCTDGKCAEPAGAHAVLIVNSTSDAFVVKNSWGHIGRDDRGGKTSVTSETGFFLLDFSYLAETKPAWAFIVPRADAAGF
jgi:hypothetical protein